ncbi:hypothetical protein [Nocardioides sp. SYSU D00038]|uniref:hypothetical protein n=1 Tax=Nocardioides sp. SYSU D00038 TaxID=2812554 RepID=UPI001966D140|nr:hypothetical protein [Nocardioides sp. SYSU D00038]
MTTTDAREAPSLGRLLDELQRARRSLAEVRSRPQRQRSEVRDAHHRLTVALEAYATALARSGRPVPYKLRDELRLCRGVDLLP